MMGALRRSQMLIGIIAILLAMTGGAYVFKTVRAGKVAHESLTAEAQNRLHNLRLPDQNGVEQDFAQWQGKIRVINFWATWCPPCRKEMPAFYRLQTKYAGNGVQFVGISLDTADNVRKYAAKEGPVYPLLIGNIAGADLAIALGNSRQALPFTVVLDRRDHIVFRHLGAVNEEELETLLQDTLRGEGTE